MHDLDDELHVDLTPLIDIIFMLVIFFIMTMSFTLPVVDFDLPQSSTAQVERHTNTLRISIDKKGTITIKDRIVSLAELTKEVQQVATTRQNHEEPAPLTLELVIDSSTPTQYLINIADLARQYTQGRLSVISNRNQAE